MSYKFNRGTTSPPYKSPTMSMEDIEKDGGVVELRPHVLIDNSALRGGERSRGGDRDGRRRPMTSVHRLSISEDDILPVGNATVPIEYRTLYELSLLSLGMYSTFKVQSTSPSLETARQSCWKLLEPRWSMVCSIYGGRSK